MAVIMIFTISINCQSGCPATYGPTGINNTCAACSSYCVYCSTNYNICDACAYGYGVTSNVCAPCVDTNCLVCTYNASICTACLTGYGVSSNICAPCTDPHCIICT